MLYSFPAILARFETIGKQSVNQNPRHLARLILLSQGR